MIIIAHGSGIISSHEHALNARWANMQVQYRQCYCYFY